LSVSSSLTCDIYGAGTYASDTGSSTCVECRACPFPGTYEVDRCTPERNNVCEVYVYDIPVSVKIVIACGQTIFVFLISWVVWRYGLRTPSSNNMEVWFEDTQDLKGCLTHFLQGSLTHFRESEENWKWTLFSVVIGVHDFVSDCTTLALIPIENPFHLFWVSVVSILCSMITSLVLSFFSSIELSWSARAFIFISGTAEDFGHEWPEKWNSRTLLCVESLPQIVVQSILLYLQGSQGFTGWDWAIWMQTVIFTLASGYKHIRKVWKNRYGETNRDNVQRADIVMTGSSTLITGVAAA
jgi:hypothetical protein